jgi:hypothetical protein
MCLSNKTIHNKIPDHFGDQASNSFSYVHDLQNHIFGILLLDSKFLELRLSLKVRGFPVTFLYLFLAFSAYLFNYIGYLLGASTH